MKIAVVLGCGMLSALLAGCSGEPTADSGSSGGTVISDLRSAPTDARCIVVTATPPSPATAVVKQISLVPGQTTVFTLTGLPVGAMTLSEQVFNVACSMTSGKTPTWIADPIMVTLVLGTPLPVTFTLRRADAGGQTSITTNFPDPPNPIAEFAVVGAGGFVGALAVGADAAVWFGGGTFLGRLASDGTVTKVALPTGVTAQSLALASDGNFWFIEEGSSPSKVARVTPSGTFVDFALSTVGAFGLPNIANVVAGPDGAMWFTENGGDKIGRVTLGGGITELAVPTAAASPSNIATGPDGNLWFTETAGNKIGRITPAGAITEFVIPTASASPSAITAAADGNLWFTEQAAAANRVARITTAGVITEFGALAEPNAQPTAITHGPDGNVWFATANAGVGRVTSAGVVTEFALPLPQTGANSIIAGPDGNVWFNEPAFQKLGRISP